MSAGKIAKIILGIVLALAGLWLILPSGVCGIEGILACKSMWRELWTVVQGVVPLALIGVGAMLVWIEAEELVMSKKK